MACYAGCCGQVPSFLLKDEPEKNRLADFVQRALKTRWAALGVMLFVGFWYFFVGGVGGSLNEDGTPKKSWLQALAPYWWMQAILAFVVLGTILGACYLIQREMRSESVRGQFIRDAEQNFSPYEDQTTYAKAHNELRQAIYARFYASGDKGPGWPKSPEEADEICEDYSKSWQRSLDDEPKKAMKGHLIRRTMAVIPRYRQVHRDFEAKLRLYQRRLISERHWEMIVAAQKQLMIDIEFIKNEAEALEEGFGSEGKIFSLASTFYYHQLEKEKKEEVDRQAQKEREIQARLEAEKEEKRQRLAEKQLQQLLKEEEGTTNKSAPRKRKSGGSK